MIEIPVIDSSVIVKYVSHESGWEEAGELVASGITLGFALVETGNALLTKVLAKEVSQNDIKLILDSLRSIILIEDELPLIQDAILLGIKLKITVYDALFIQLALSVKEGLVTSDVKQADAAMKVGVKTTRLK